MFEIKEVCYEVDEAADSSSLLLFAAAAAVATIVALFSAVLWTPTAGVDGGGGEIDVEDDEDLRNWFNWFKFSDDVV